jgi:hypothetical protein
MMIYLDVHTPETETITGKKAAQKETAVRTVLSAKKELSYLPRKKSSDRTYCPYCNRESVLIWVHGHYQCSRCKCVVNSCCEAN